MKSLMKLRKGEMATYLNVSCDMDPCILLEAQVGKGETLAIAAHS